MLFTERVVDYTTKVLFPLAPLQFYYCQHFITTSGDYYSVKIQHQQQQQQQQRQAANNNNK